MSSTNPAQRIDIDHAAHFVPDIVTAGAALTGLGFTLTPLSAQSHRAQPGGPVVPAGTSNRCVMLQKGYVEFLTPTHDTTNAQQLRNAIARYTGVHLIAFGTDAPDADYARLQREDFAPLPPLALQRQTCTEHGAATARFTVVRVPPQAMAEGRMQYCQHHTPEVVWQPRWLAHANHAVGLAAIIVCVADPAQAAQRYTRFTGQPVCQSHGTWRLDTGRGYVLFADALTLQQALGIAPPTLPWIAGCVIDSDDMNATRSLVGGTAIGDRLCVTLPHALGGVMIFQPAGADVLTLDKITSRPMSWQSLPSGSSPTEP